MVTPFVMTYEHLQDIHSLVRLASRPERLIALQEMEVASRGFNPDDPETRVYSPVPLDQTITLPFGWKVTLSVEEHPFGRAMHLSVSSPAVGRLPSVEVVEFIMGAIGFSNGLEELKAAGLLYLEQYSRRGSAVNVLEPLDCKLSELGH